MKSEKFLDLARERFRRAVDAERANRAEAKIDLQFCVGEQWDPEVKRIRLDSSNPRPCLVFQKLTGPVQQTSNEARQNRPSVKVSAISNGEDKDVADVLEGMIRHITVDTHGDVAGEIAVDGAIRCGFGFFGLTTRYCAPDDPENWDQEIAFRSFPNQFLVYVDCDAKEPDKSDAEWAFVLEWLTRAEYESRYPGSEVHEANFFDGAECPCPEWIGEGKLLVAEYWHIEKKRKTITRNGQTRTIESRQVVCSLINGYEVLDETEWAGKWIPIIPVYGPEINIDGVVYRQSLPRPGRDPQRLHNFYKSVEAETIALAPRPKWVGAVGQFKTDRNWGSGSMANVATLQYDPVATNGILVGAPTWHTFEPPVQALSVGAMQTADDIKAATNIFDASLGARSNETSGKAIDARKFESDMANSHFLDNLSRAITFAGKQLIDLIPKIYDTPREIQIVGEDEAKKVVHVNEPYIDPETGKPTTYMLGQGKFAVAVTTGPSYSTKRKESFELFSDLSKAYPPLMQAAGDIILRNSDIPGADAVADRLKKTLPANLQSDDDGQNALSPAAQAKLEQQNQMIDQLTATVHHLSSQIETKAAEGATRERVALIGARASITQALIRAQSTEAITAFNAELSHIDRQLSLIKDPADGLNPSSGQSEPSVQPTA